MKTKFSQILKLKKRRVEEIENALTEVRAKKRRTLLEIKNIVDEISRLKTPTSGSFAQVSIAFLSLSKLSNQKKSKELELEQIDLQIQEIQELYKEANIEFEKIKYLEDEEIKKALEALKVQEAKDMDEIANLLHTRFKKEVEA
jgi:flagellar biosynthesis chaperone FliJ